MQHVTYHQEIVPHSEWRKPPGGRYETFRRDERNHMGCACRYFIPAAASRLVTKEHVARLAANGLEVISSGANVPFADREVFYGAMMEYVNQRLSLIPDFIANCGMAGVFAYLMQRNVEISDDTIFSDVSHVIYRVLAGIRERSPTKTNISSRAYKIALKELV